MSSKTVITDFDPNGAFAGLVVPPRFRDRQKQTRFKQRWVLTPYQYAALMAERFKGPAKQRGSIILAAFGVQMGGAGGSVLLTGGSISKFLPGNTCFAGVRFNNDGGIDQRGTSSTNYAAWFTGEWWTNEPDGTIGNSYDVRALSGGSGTWNQSAATDNTWIQISTNRLWSVDVLSKFSPDILIASRTFEIRDTGSGSALDSATISCTAEN